jgi:pimeloyl-ACP methyl ester carboxylesterase
MEYLASEGVAVYGLDARGYGGTPRDESGWLEPDRMAMDVREVLLWLRNRHPDASRPVVLGWSYGSAVAHLTAQRWPELVGGVALYGYFKDPAVDLPVSTDPSDPPREATTREGTLSDFITPRAGGSATRPGRRGRSGRRRAPSPRVVRDAHPHVVQLGNDLRSSGSHRNASRA